jgi:hypothetical protein
MNQAQVQALRNLADGLHLSQRLDWEWVGRVAAQRMCWITEDRARDYAALYGGIARPMTEAA